MHQGGMAALWRVSEPGIDMPMLMKVPYLGEGADPAAIVSFEMEQMILPRLSGPHVPRVIAVGEFAVQPYVVMQRIDGNSLLRRLDNLPLPYTEVAQVGVKIANALDDLHRQHIVHLDVKPHHAAAFGRGRAARFWAVASSATARFDAGGIPRALRHRALHVAGAVERHSQRSAQRSVRARRAFVFFLDRNTPIRRRRNLKRHAQAAVARSRAAAQIAARLSAMAAGDRAAAARAASLVALPDDGAACLRSEPSPSR